MHWYSVNLLFKAKNVKRPEIDPLWEERIILIRANYEEEAKILGIQIGKSEEHEYIVNDGKEKETQGMLKWSFVQIESIFQIEDDNLASGTEIFSRFLRDSEVKSLLTPFKD